MFSVLCLENVSLHWDKRLFNVVFFSPKGLKCYFPHFSLYQEFVCIWAEVDIECFLVQHHLLCDPAFPDCLAPYPARLRRWRPSWVSSWLFLPLHWFPSLPMPSCSASIKQTVGCISVSGRISYPQTTFFRICLAVLSSLFVHILFRKLSLPSSLIKPIGIVTVIASNLKVIWEKIDIFSNIKSSYPQIHNLYLISL